MRRKHVPINFEIIACFVETNLIRLNKDMLINYFESSGINYTIKQLPFDEDNSSTFWCSEPRRKIIYETAFEHNCNKLALGHNLDDVAKMILMDLCFEADVNTSIACLDLFDGKLKVIRPLSYLSKEDILNFTSKESFPDTGYESFYGEDLRLKSLKEAIDNLEKHCPYVKKNIFRAMRKVRRDYLL